MPLQVETVQRPDWTPVPYDGCCNVDFKSLLRLDHLFLALLRFDKQATLHEHDAPITIDVVCLEGSGFVSVGAEVARIQAGERVRWPAHIPHRLWTEDSEMVILMAEHNPRTRNPFALHTA